jgi:hypothetical protein
MTLLITTIALLWSCVALIFSSLDRIAKDRRIASLQAEILRMERHAAICPLCLGGSGTQAEHDAEGTECCYLCQGGRWRDRRPWDPGVSP